MSEPTAPDSSRRLVIDADTVDKEVSKIADQVLGDHDASQTDVFVGIETRGVPLAQRVTKHLKDRLPDLETGTLDISLYRDDLDNLGTIPAIRGSQLPVTLEGKRVILFDDVLFTGRTIRAAIDALMDYGRPARIELAVLVDRGNRELPIAATYCGRRLETVRDDHVAVRFTECDGEDGVYLL